MLQEIQKLAVKKKTPNIRSGQTVKVHQRIKEGEKERVQIFEGLIIAINSGYGADKTFTVRRIVEGIGVEKIFPVYSTNIEKIEIKKKSKVRRAKLYYMRELSGKSARLKETFLDDKEMQKAIEELAEQKAKEEAAMDKAATGEQVEQENISEAPPTMEEAVAEETPDQKIPAEEVSGEETTMAKTPEQPVETTSEEKAPKEETPEKQ